MISTLQGYLDRLQPKFIVFLIMGIVLVCQLTSLVRSALAPRPSPQDMFLSHHSDEIVRDFANFDPFFPRDTGTSPSVEPSVYELYGLRVESEPTLGSAIIAGPDGIQNSYAVGTEIEVGIRLSSVAFDHAILDKNGRKIKLTINQTEGNATSKDVMIEAGDDGE